MINRIAGYTTAEDDPRLAGKDPKVPTPQSLRHWVDPVEEVITKHPGACLASAFIVGVVFAWWIKRK
jgi:hypothetical protein